MARPPSRSLAAVVVALALAAPAPAAAQQAGLDDFLAALDFREMGPATMGGRVSDLAIHPSAPATWYVGLATGGVWKTTSHGSSWTPLWDDQPCPSIGAVAVAPSSPNVLWVGTGEPQNRQSSPWGCGVFRSTDGGRTWSSLGLEDTRHVSRIVVHPTDPDVAWVGAVGRLWGPNEERGVYRTTDAGRTWDKVLFIDEDTGVIDLAADASDPNTLFAATYSRRRTGFGFSASGGGGGIWRSSDGGDTWERLSEGLPEGEIGRVGLDVHDRDGDLVYATVEATGGDTGLYRSRDRGATWEKVSSNNPRPMYFSLVRIDPNNPDRIYLGGVQLQVSDDGGRTWWDRDGAENIHVDHHALWIDPSDSDHVVLGTDGGLATTFDGAETWRAITNMAIGQFYEVDVDDRDPYWVCGGLQDNGNWCAPTHSLDGFGVDNDHWIPIHTGDGFHNHPDPFDPEYVYTESQGGNMARVHVATGQQQDMRPIARTDDEDAEYRWNWNTPIVVSRHARGTVYAAGNHLLRSRDHGITWEEASPDLTKNLDRDTLRIFGRPLGEEHLSRNDGIGAYGTITAAAESPLDARVLWAGTDDGNLQVTTDGGATWSNVVERVPGLPPHTYVSRIDPSHHEPGRVYVSFDGHRNDDFAPYVFTSDDFGRSWRRITDGLPDWSVNTVREHPRTPSLLFAGNEIGMWVTFDRGERWHRLEGDLPTVPVDDIAIQERENDLVVGTHGRSVWILSGLGPLEAQARADVVAEAVELFEPQRATQWSIAFAWPFQGDRFAGENPADGAVLRYWLRDGVEAAPAVTDGGTASGDGGASGNGGSSAGASPADGVRLVVSDDTGTPVRTLDGPAG
ncbi:MAG: glycosyl hydrolase, partial [Gemmatimonadetes bacterium]|nr:glycosyl hydrolase [Gemmatimonadota bacterium]